MLSAKEIATKYAGRTVKCKVTTSSPVFDLSGKNIDYFDAKVVGYKLAFGADPAYVCVEVLPPHQTKLKLAGFKAGYVFTITRNTDGYGKKLLPEEIVPLADTEIAMASPSKKKDIPEWPDKCKDCGSPAYIGDLRIDCSNPGCKNKFKTHSAFDLFLPTEMRPPGWDKDPNRKRRSGVDKDDFVICDTCKKRAVDGSFNKKDKLGEFSAKCPDGHTWKSDLHIGDKIMAKSGVLAYKGKNVFVPYRI